MTKLIIRWIVCGLQTPFFRAMALLLLLSSSLTSCLRSSRAAPARQPLSLLSSPRTLLFKTHAVKSANTHVFPVTHGSGLRASNSHLLCSVMLLDERFALPRADLHHRSKSNWSCVRRQGRDSPRSFSVTVLTTLLFPLGLPAYVPPSAEPSEDSSVLQLVSCFCRHRASWSVGTSRQASPCTHRPVSETRAHTPPG